MAKAIAAVVDAPFGKRPFRVHIDPSQDGAEIVNGVADRVRAELFREMARWVDAFLPAPGAPSIDVPPAPEDKADDITSATA